MSPTVWSTTDLIGETYWQLPGVLKCLENGRSDAIFRPFGISALDPGSAKDVRDGQFLSWVNFHERYPDAGDLVQLSQVVFNDRVDQAAVHIELGRNCLNAWGATFYLENQAGRWVVTGSKNNA